MGTLLGLAAWSLRSLWCRAAADSHTASAVSSSAQWAQYQRSISIEGRYSVILGLEPHLWLLTQMKVGTPAGVLSPWFCDFLAEFRGMGGGGDSQQDSQQGSGGIAWFSGPRLPSWG